MFERFYFLSIVSFKSSSSSVNRRGGLELSFYPFFYCKRHCVSFFLPQRALSSRRDSQSFFSLCSSVYSLCIFVVRSFSLPRRALSSHRVPRRLSQPITKSVLQSFFQSFNICPKHSLFGIKTPKKPTLFFAARTRLSLCRQPTGLPRAVIPDLIGNRTILTVPSFKRDLSFAGMTGVTINGGLPRINGSPLG